MLQSHYKVFLVQILIKHTSNRNINVWHLTITQTGSTMAYNFVPSFKAHRTVQIGQCKQIVTCTHCTEMTHDMIALFICSYYQS